MIVIAIVIIVAIAGIGIYQLVLERGKDYEIEQIKQYNYFVLKQNNQYGVIDRQGNTIITPEYNEIKIPNPEKAVFVCYQGESTKILNEKKEEITTNYSNIQPIQLENIIGDLIYEKSVLKYSKDGKYGLINFEGKEITKPIYDEINSLPYKEGELLVKQNDKYGVINIKGNTIIEMEYDEIKVDGYYTDENKYQYAGYIALIKTPEGYRYGYLNEKGKEVLQTQYNAISRVTEIQDNHNAYLIASKNGQFGVMKNEETIIANEYQSIQYDGTNKVLVIEKSKKYGIANLEGKVIVPVQYNQIDITGIYFYAQNEQGITVYNNNGTEAQIDANIAIVNTGNEKYKIRIKNEDGTTLYGVINQEGKQLIEEKYSYIEYLYDNYFIISNENRKLGIIDAKDNVKVEASHDSLQKIKDTDLIQAVPDNKTIEIYDKTMKKICEMKEATLEVQKNYIKIGNEEETKYFSKDGKELKNTEVYPNNKLLVSVKDGKYGFIDRNGNLIVDYKYDKAFEFNEYGFATIEKEGKWGAINEKGEEVAAPTYEFENQKQPSFIKNYYQVPYGFGEFYYTDEQ